MTGLALGVLGVLAVLVFWPSYGLDTLDRPEESLERVVGRDMDFRTAARAAPAWERRLHALASSSDAAARADAISWYDELVRIEGSPLGRAPPNHPARRGRADGDGPVGGGRLGAG
jgi:hypothetical protein